MASKRSPANSVVDHGFVQYSWSCGRCSPGPMPAATLGGGSDGSVDRTGARDGDDVVLLAQRREPAEHFGAHRLDVLRSEAADAAWQPDRLQQPAFLPAADRVLMHAEGPGDFTD